MSTAYTQKKVKRSYIRPGVFAWMADAMWQEYERRKSAWIAANPTASEAEYNTAIRRILKELGL